MKTPHYESLKVGDTVCQDPEGPFGLVLAATDLWLIVEITDLGDAYATEDCGIAHECPWERADCQLAESLDEAQP